VPKSAKELAAFSQSGCEYDGRVLELGERIVSVGSGLLLRCGLVYNDLFLSGSLDDEAPGRWVYLAFSRTLHRTPAERQFVQG
jgi:hypothetical protein